MFSPEPKSPRSKGFTLIELLTVIAVIAVLVGLLFPAAAAVKDAARKAKAKNDVIQLVNAIRAYYTEYGRYPLPGGEAGQDIVYSGGQNSNAVLCNILRAVSDNDPLNPRRIVFLEVPPVKNPASPKGGVAQDGMFFDPWGNGYVVFVDGDYDHSLETILSKFYSGENRWLRSGVAAVSLGRDGKWGNEGDGKLEGSDDVVSWQ